MAGVLRQARTLNKGNVACIFGMKSTLAVEKAEFLCSTPFQAATETVACDVKHFMIVVGSVYASLTHSTGMSVKW